MSDQIAVVMPLLIREPWQASMTEHAIECLRLCTQVPFDLILPEVDNGKEDFFSCCDVHIAIKHAGTATADINLGIRAARERGCTKVVYTGNDVFVRPGWLEALLDCFDQHDCGIATLASADLMRTPAAVHFGQDMITEGVYGPFMMFDVSEELDEQNFPGPFADSDLIMRIYEKDLRMYRNNRVIIEHLNKQSMGPDHQANFEEAAKRFKDLHGNSGLLMYRILTEGWIV